jgi:uncharacterized protein (DUF2062 family)
MKLNLKLKELNKTGLIVMLLGILILSYGFYDRFKYPQYYKINRTWNNYEQRYVEGNISKAIYYTKNITANEDLAKPFLIRYWIYKIAFGVSGGFLFYVLWSWWFSKTPEERDEILEGLNEQQNEKGINEKGERNSEEESTKKEDPGGCAK